jgi:Type VI secretion system/phage-baseplate injector OB domain
MDGFYGKYCGTVENNVDPRRRGRVQVSVPSVLGDGRMSWAEACVPYAGPGVGFFAVPPVGALVWVEFEGGDPDCPILAGAAWRDEQAPAQGDPAVKVWKTDAITITLSDLQDGGGLTIDVGAPAVDVPMRLALTSAGIELSIGRSRVTLSPTTVSINDGALEVT